MKKYRPIFVCITLILMLLTTACQLDPRRVSNVPASMPDWFNFGQSESGVQIIVYADLSEQQIDNYINRQQSNVVYRDEANTQIDSITVQLGQFSVLFYPRLTLTEDEIALYRDDKDTLIIYTALSNEQVERYLPVFAQTQTGLTIVLVRDSTGPITAKLAQEASNPVADVVWGISTIALLSLDAVGTLEAYEPAGIDRIPPNLRDELDPPTWVGIDVFVGALCVNTQKIAELGLPMPFSWRDLTKPVYRNPQTGEGYLVMPNPAESGTGYLLVSSFFEVLGGEESGWAYMSDLHQNMRNYTDSGSAPCRLAALGEIPIGLSFAGEAVEQNRDFGRPVLAIFPDEGVGYAIEANALVRKPSTKEIAYDFLDWAISDAAMQEYAWFYPVTAAPAPNPYPLPDNYPANIQELMIPDARTSWYTANYERITTQWLRLFSDQSDLSK